MATSRFTSWFPLVACLELEIAAKIQLLYSHGCVCASVDLSVPHMGVTYKEEGPESCLNQGNTGTHKRHYLQLAVFQFGAGQLPNEKNGRVSKASEAAPSSPSPHISPEVALVRNFCLRR